MALGQRGELVATFWKRKCKRDICAFREINPHSHGDRIIHTHVRESFQKKTDAVNGARFAARDGLHEPSQPLHLEGREDSQVYQLATSPLYRRTALTLSFFLEKGQKRQKVTFRKTTRCGPTSRGSCARSTATSSRAAAAQPI